MPTITVTINGKKKKYNKGITISDIAESLNLREILAATLNDSVVDLSRKVTKNSDIKLISFNTHEGKEVFHHSTAHVLAHAVLRLFPKSKLTIGPTIEGGYYYDIDMNPLTLADLSKIEKEMQKIVDEDYNRTFQKLQFVSSEETDWTDCPTRALVELLEAISNGGNISCTPEDGIRVCEICEKIINY